MRALEGAKHVKLLWRDGKFTGCGFVKFDTAEAARQASLKATVEFHGREAVVELCKPKGEREQW